MNISDFMALLEFVKNTMVSTFTCLDGIVIVSDGSSTLTLLGFFVSVGFIMLILQFIKNMKKA